MTTISSYVKNRSPGHGFSLKAAVIHGIWMLPLVLISNAWGDCLDAANLKALDYRYEQALRTGDKRFLDELLAEDFVWVHNHASQLETKQKLLGRFGEDYRATKAREQAGVQVRRLGDAAVILGSTTVEEFKADGLHINTYQFLRTDVATDKGCRLLAGQTMKTWSSEGPVK
jgi:ketosteroid isomerase-like protein